MEYLELHNIVKYFGAVKAVSNLSFKVSKGEFLTLLGPSGCGKTTTLNLIAGLEMPASGEIFLEGRFLNDVPPNSRNLAMVFQNYALYPNMTVYNNLGFSLRLRKWSKKKIDEKVKWAASILGIEDLLKRLPKELSGGQQQRVAFGRSIVRNPKIFLMDEPLSNLDAKLRVQMRFELKRLQMELGATTIYVTHDQAEALSISDRIAVFRDGMIEQIDDPQNIYNQPANEYVAKFVGNPEINLLTGVLGISEEHGVFILENNDVIHIDKDVARNIIERSGRKEVTLGIRPEDVLIKKKGEGNENYSTETTVLLAETVGSDDYIETILGNRHFIVRTRPQHHFSTGSRVLVKLLDEKIFAFEIDSKRRIK